VWDARDTPNDCGFDRLLPVWWRGDVVLQIHRNRRRELLNTARLLVGDQNCRVVEVLWMDLLANAQKAAGDAVQEDVVVVCLVDLTVHAARLAVRDQAADSGVGLEAHGTFNSRDAVVVHNVVYHVGFCGELLSGKWVSVGIW
jgi:hypothetical protein